MSSFGAALGSSFLGLAGGYMAKKSQENQADKNRALQGEFARKGIRWRVADAQAAGISPLVAMGASTHQYQPEHIGSDPMAEAVQNTGQNISRAIEKKQELENDLLRASIYKTKAEASQIANLSGSKSNNPDYEGKGPSYSTLHGPDGTRIRVMSDYAAQRLEEDVIAKVQAGLSRMNPANEEKLIKRMKLTKEEKKKGYRGFTWTPLGYKPIKGTKDKSIFHKWKKVKKHYGKKFRNQTKKYNKMFGIK